MPNERRLLKLATGIAQCTPQAAAYGTCVAKQAEKVTKDACAAEFTKLLECVKKHVDHRIEDRGGCLNPSPEQSHDSPDPVVDFIAISVRRAV